MQLDNFEKQVQHKLSNREIKPSANSWDRLDAMLSVEETPKKKGFLWKNIAASFIVLASVGYYFYNQNTTVEPIKEESIVVEENSEFRIQNSENKEESTESTKEVLVENTILINGNKNSSISKLKVVAISESNNQQPTTNNQHGVSMMNQSTVNNNEPNAQNKQPTNSKYISAEKLLAEVSGEDFRNNKTENKEVKKRISISPNALLSNVESELNQTYRETAFEKLNKNLNSIKTVLVNRNYEE